MKKILCMAVVVGAAASLGASLITQDEALVSGALSELKFVAVPGKPGLVGAPPKFKVTDQTISHLSKLMKDGKVIEIQGNGSLKILAAK